MPTELEERSPLETAVQAVQICLKDMGQLPHGRTINEIAGANLNVCEQPLAGRSRLLDLHPVRNIPYMDGGPDEGDVYVPCLCLDKSSTFPRWVMWSQHRRSTDQSYFHDFTTLNDSQFGQLLDASGGRESTLLFAILKKLTMAIRDGKKRSLERYETRVIQDRDMNMLVETSAWHPF